MLLGAMVFSLVYLMLYPGLGSYEGLLNWSQGKRLVSSYENYETSFDTRRAEIANLSLAEVQADPVLMATADRISAANAQRVMASMAAVRRRFFQT
jgi:cytochrome c oxidase cbb3-type subunit 3